jgi:hypothetical protein
MYLNIHTCSSGSSFSTILALIGGVLRTQKLHLPKKLQTRRRHQEDKKDIKLKKSSEHI